MSEERLPVRIDPIRLAEQRRRLHGTVDLAAMDRLAGYLAAPGGEAEVALEFGTDLEGIRAVTGRISADVSLSCQGCLLPITQRVESEVSLGVVRNAAQAERLPERYDPLEVGAEPLFLRDLIEEELILALPLVPRHPAGECPGEAWAERGAGVDEETGEQPTENPFAALSELKRKPSKNPDED